VCGPRGYARGITSKGDNNLLLFPKGKGGKLMSSVLSSWERGTNANVVHAASGRQVST
jgi:hypothetical protein